MSGKVMLSRPMAADVPAGAWACQDWKLTAAASVGPRGLMVSGCHGDVSQDRLLAAGLQRELDGLDLAQGLVDDAFRLQSKVLLRHCHPRLFLTTAERLASDSGFN